jgi:multiple antibiotic resistance protein
MDWTEQLKFFAALLSIVNPVGAVPLFISLTEHFTAAQRARTRTITALAVGGVLVAALLTGEAILGFFGITIASFRVGGGILVLLIAVSMMHARMSPAKHTDDEARDASEKNEIAVVPLGIPLLAGPGAISTTIVFAHRGHSLGHYAIGVGSILLIALLVWLSFRLAPLMARVLGRTGINIITRLMGLIIAAIGVEFIANGLKELLPGLAG